MKLCISCYRLKLVLLLFLVKNPLKNTSIRLAKSSWIQRWADKIEFPTLQVAPWCLPSAYRASTSLRDCKNPICPDILQTSKTWQTDPCLTLTLKHTDTQAVTCIQNALKFLHHFKLWRKTYEGHSTRAPCTHKTGQDEASRASPKGTDCYSAPYTQITRVLFSQVPLMRMDRVFNHIPFP